MPIPGQKPAPSWQNRLILHPDDANELEAESALGEFRDGKTQGEAEESAYQNYKRKKLTEAAAHHLRGMKGALAVGDKRAAQKHAALYEMHAATLGGDKIGPTHPDVLAYMEEKPGKYRFSGHKADKLANPEVLKSENYLSEITKILTVLDRFDDL